MSTLTFPQLATGALAQYPAQKHVLQRTIVNSSLGASTTKMSDPEGASVLWELTYTGLTDAEMSALEQLFQDCEGRLRVFEFVDPASNLLRWTEDLSHTVWQGGLQANPDIGDPVGGNAAATLTNGAQAPQELGQTIDAPASYIYTFSVWVRSSSTSIVHLQVAGFSAVSGVSPDWDRISISAPAGSSDGQLTCSIQVPGGSSIEIYGPQLEAQQDASGYKRNDGYLNVCRARFDQDELERTSYGPDNHSTRVRVQKVQE